MKNEVLVKRGEVLFKPRGRGPGEWLKSWGTEPKAPVGAKAARSGEVWSPGLNDSVRAQAYALTPIRGSWRTWIIPRGPDCSGGSAQEAVASASAHEC